MPGSVSGWDCDLKAFRHWVVLLVGDASEAVTEPLVVLGPDVKQGDVGDGCGETCTGCQLTVSGISAGLVTKARAIVFLIMAFPSNFWVKFSLFSVHC